MAFQPVHLEGAPRKTGRDDDPRPFTIDIDRVPSNEWIGCFEGFDWGASALRLTEPYYPKVVFRGIALPRFAVERFDVFRLDLEYAINHCNSMEAGEEIVG